MGASDYKVKNDGTIESYDHKTKSPVADVTKFGAVGNDSTDDSSAIADAIASLLSTGGTLISPPGKIYKVTDGFWMRGSISVEFHGSKIKRYGSSFPTTTPLFYYQSPTLYTRTFTGTVNAGDVTFTLSSSAGLSVGDSVVLQFGEAEYDASQPWLTMFNTVGAIVGSDVTFKIPVPEDINKGTSNKCLVLTRVVENVSVRNIKFEDDLAAETDSVMYIERCRNILLQNVFIPTAAGALINAQSENVTFDNIVSRRSRYYAGLGSSGTFIGGWGFRNFSLSNIFGEAVDRNGIAFEAMGRGARIENLWIQQGSDGTPADYGVYVLGFCKDIHIKGYHYHSTRGTSHALELGNQGEEVTTEDVTIPYGNSFPLKNHRGSIGWTDGAGNLLIHYHKTKQFTKIFRITANMSWVDIGIPDGIWKSGKIFINDKTGVTGFLFGNSGGGSKDIIADLPASGVLGDLSFELFMLGNTATYPFNNLNGKRTWLTTDGTVVDGAYGVLEIEYYPITDDDSKGLIQTCGIIPEGDLEILAGEIRLVGPAKGIIMTNAAGTVTKRARLDDAGTGLIFEDE